ncbi:DUF418 domain-containing protein [Ammoniphilus sp. YIM 78166]|uniref:DUF418 domain-containing protein n=1 Tax=Ammoniphilus sp. YIM 78166 TaxID=1644106 RepID=UPI00106F2FC5|nr:DUF418 domain-containing protein [Ammoniphilus sp. YIM 78166]
MSQQPITTDQRLVIMDIVRGFALFGILLVNMPALISTGLLRDLYMVPPQYSGIDAVLRLGLDLFVQGKFYPIFSFLFGWGFYVFMKRAEVKGRSVYFLFTRRLVFLLALGLIHLIVFWTGDILHTYAIGGFFLLLFYKRKTVTLLVWALLFFIALYGLYALEVFFPPPEYQQYVQTRQLIGMEKLDLALKAYQSGSFYEWFQFRYTHEVMPVLRSFIGPLLGVFPLFLLGLYAGRLDYFTDIFRHKRLFHVILAGSACLSLPLLVLLFLVNLELVTIGANIASTRVLLINVSGMTMSFFYISSLVLLCIRQDWEKRLRPLALVGRMALSNYLGQTLITLLLMFTFNLYGKLSLWEGVLLSVLVFIIQVILSHYWLSRYTHGPMEWLWRKWTYVRSS